MKDQSGAAIQYSGYPLTIVQLKEKSRAPKLTLIRPEVNHRQTISIQENKITNDPKSWDDNWFNGYE
jgi:hypothetical protein